MPRLILWPLAAYVVGKEEFGIFVTAYAVAFIVGIQPGNGLATGLLRHLSDYDEQERAQLCGIAMKLGHKATVAIALTGLLLIGIVGYAGLVSWRLLNCIVPLTISLYFENQAHVLLAEKRFRRQFRERTLWLALRSTINVAGALLAAIFAGLVGLAWGFTVGNAVVYIILRMRRGQWFSARYNAGMAAVLKKVWLQITIAGVISVAGPYINRLVLSGVRGFEQTADLVAATSVTFIFLAPITCVGGLLLSIISRYTSIQKLSQRAKLQWLTLLIFGTTICPFVFRLIAPPLILLLYPSFGTEAVVLLRIMTWMIVSETLISMSRPIVMKFGPIQLPAVVNSASLVATLVPALLLIPAYGSVGAAWAIAIGSMATGSLWLGGTGWVYIKSHSKPW